VSGIYLDFLSFFRAGPVVLRFNADTWQHFLIFENAPEYILLERLLCRFPA
jgi:hypothetical protein